MFPCAANSPGTRVTLVLQKLKLRLSVCHDIPAIASGSHFRQDNLKFIV
jgi:hypothetical protein